VLFPTVRFAIFFALVLPTSWLLAHRRTRWRVFMVAASYFFYGSWDGRFVFLLAGSTLGNQAVTLLIHRSSRRRVRDAWLALGIALNLGLLAWFKYYDFFVNSATSILSTFGSDVQLPLRQLVLPVGISFITFQALSYVIDTYRGHVEPTSMLDFAVYLSFFPHLVAGPIVRASEFLPQLKERLDPRRVDTGLAFWLIASGLFKKVVISSYLASHIVDPVFNFPHQHQGFDTLLGIYGYAIQIYADFSGYTDMAIGLALLLGFRFPQNFDSPYAANSLQDFWRRWHMTLSRWLRDYLYIPLGGNRQGKRRGYVNLAITMILGGLWHGAAWTFVVWGSLHGVGLAVERWRADVRRNRPPEVIEAEAAAQASRTGIDWPLWGRRALTFHLVCLGWVFFRAQTFTNAFQVLGRLFHFGMGTPFNPVLVGVIVGSIAVQYLPRDLSGKLRAAFSRSSWWAQTVLLSGFMVVTNALGPIGVAPFIYFKF
jgi:D-alanyl-lipoteichoic acid acyltransferase DltB (MBOAT superfamily)